MALKDTCKTLRNLLAEIQADLDKAEAGNKAAAQRVRTSSIKFEKTAKVYRKESVKADKNGAMKKAKVAAKKKPAGKERAPQPPAKAPQAKPSKSRPAPKKSAPAKKVPTAKKKPTAKIPSSGKKKK